MRKVFFLVIPLFVLLIILNTPSVYAHPGRTAADGCHYCRTNCDEWGVPWNERHCHGGSTVQPVQEQQPVYNPPTNTPRPLPTWTPYPTKTPIPTYTPKPTYTPTPTKSPTPKPTKKLTITPKKTVKKATKAKKAVKQEAQKKTFWQWLFGR